MKCAIEQGSTPGTIILLNGTSSSGKTSLLHALQAELEAPYLEAGLDKFLWMLPKRYRSLPLWNDVLGPATRAGTVGERLIFGMHRAIAALAHAGVNVIADHVLVQRSWLLQCVAEFSGLPVLFVGVLCPLSVIEERERLRGDRTLGQAAAQIELVHAGVNYHVTVDTSLQSPVECARLIKHRLDCLRSNETDLLRLTAN